MSQRGSMMLTGNYVIFNYILLWNISINPSHLILE